MTVKSVIESLVAGKPSELGEEDLDEAHPQGKQLQTMIASNVNLGKIASNLRDTAASLKKAGFSEASNDLVTAAERIESSMKLVGKNVQALRSQ